MSKCLQGLCRWLFELSAQAESMLVQNSCRDPGADSSPEIDVERVNAVVRSLLCIEHTWAFCRDSAEGRCDASMAAAATASFKLATSFCVAFSLARSFSAASCAAAAAASAASLSRRSKLASRRAARMDSLSIAEATSQAASRFLVSALPVNHAATLRQDPSCCVPKGADDCCHRPAQPGL